jgi:hypothetical protein
MRRNDVSEAMRLFPMRLEPWLRSVYNRRAYEYVDADDLIARRRSDTVFILGSGGSLNEMDAAAWSYIERHDTFGFNWWVHQRFVRTDFHLIRGIPDTDADPSVWKPQVAEYFRVLRANPLFSDTVFLVQSGFRAINGNRAIGYRLLPERNPVFLWRSSIRVGPPSRTFRAGLVHGQSTIQECINAAYLLGWSRIVLVGVDLYDRRYFWLPTDTTRSVDVLRGASVSDPHAQGSGALVETLGRWREWLAREGCDLLVWNPKSLLTRTLPVYAAS